MSNIKKLAFKKTNGCCAYCGIKLSLNKKDDNYIQIDHIIPRSKCGKNTLENYFCCCRSCNSSKGSKTIESYRILIMKKQIPIVFNEIQIKYLKRIGIDIFKYHKIKKHIFFYETRSNHV